MTSDFGPSDLAIVAPEQNQGYEGWQLPCERDREIARIVERLARRPEGLPLPGSLGVRHGHVFVAFAERMASLAVRRRSAEYLHVGLLAAALAASVSDDPREAILVLPLLWRSAQILGVDPFNEFTTAGNAIGGAGGQQLLDFLSRSQDDRTIESMGYTEDMEQDGFRYKRTW